MASHAGPALAGMNPVEIESGDRNYCYDVLYAFAQDNYPHLDSEQTRTIVDQTLDNLGAHSFAHYRESHQIKQERYLTNLLLWMDDDHLDRVEGIVAGSVDEIIQKSHIPLNTLLDIMGCEHTKQADIVDFLESSEALEGYVYNNYFLDKKTEEREKIKELMALIKDGSFLESPEVIAHFLQGVTEDRKDIEKIISLFQNGPLFEIVYSTRNIDDTRSCRELGFVNGRRVVLFSDPKE